VNARREAACRELLERSREHDAREPDRLRRYRNVEPETAELLAVLVRTMHRPRVLELGTSNGYSTIWLADAVEAVGGELLSVEVDPVRTSEARGHLARLGLSAELRTEDGADTLAGSPKEAWHLVFLDAERPAYAGYWPDLLRTLRRGALLVIDNALSHAEEMTEIDALIAGEPSVASALLPVGAGVRLVVKSQIG